VPDFDYNVHEALSGGTFLASAGTGMLLVIKYHTV